MTPLLLACGERKQQCVDVLIEAKADVNLASATGITPLLTSAANSDLKTMKVLIEAKADVNATEKDGFSPLHIIVSKGNEVGVKMLLEAKADVNLSASGCYPLHIALDIDKPKTRNAIVKVLLDANASITAVDPDGQTPLVHAIRAEARSPALELTKLLLERNASPEECAGDLKPLHVAVSVGSIAAVKLLLERKADVNSTLPNQGFTPLHIAALSNALDVAKILVEAKADLDTKDAGGMNAVFHAAMQGHDAFCTFLADKGADLSLVEDETAIEMMRMELKSLHVTDGGTDITPDLLGEGDEDEGESKSRASHGLDGTIEEGDEEEDEEEGSDEEERKAIAQLEALGDEEEEAQPRGKKGGKKGGKPQSSQELSVKPSGSTQPKDADSSLPPHHFDEQD